jgi:hypothetical protein
LLDWQGNIAELEKFWHEGPEYALVEGEYS